MVFVTEEAHELHDAPAYSRQRCPVGAVMTQYGKQGDEEIKGEREQNYDQRYAANGAIDRGEKISQTEEE
jgi:hypothetical protein